MLHRTAITPWLGKPEEEVLGRFVAGIQEELPATKQADGVTDYAYSQGQRPLKCWHQRVSEEHPPGTRADSRVFGDLRTAAEARCLPLFPIVASY